MDPARIIKFKFAATPQEVVARLVGNVHAGLKTVGGGDDESRQERKTDGDDFRVFMISRVILYYSKILAPNGRLTDDRLTNLIKKHAGSRAPTVIERSGRSPSPITRARKAVTSSSGRAVTTGLLRPKL